MRRMQRALAVVAVTLGTATALHAQTARARVKPATPAARVEAAAPPPAASAPAEADRADIDRTAIVGNRELPKVLHIVPWKKPLPGELAGRPVSSVLDEALAPLDRDVFRRQIDYDAQARGHGSRAAAVR